MSRLPRRMRRPIAWLAAAALLPAALALVPAAPAQDAKSPTVDAADDGWIVGDIDAGYELAKETGRPLLVAFR